MDDPTLVVRSPTYTYYQKYSKEILEDSSTIALIEWPEILGDRIQYTTKISIEVMENGDRKVIIETS